MYVFDMFFRDGLENKSFFYEEDKAWHISLTKLT